MTTESEEFLLEKYNHLAYDYALQEHTIDKQYDEINKLKDLLIKAKIGDNTPLCDKYLEQSHIIEDLRYQIYELQDQNKELRNDIEESLEENDRYPLKVTKLKNKIHVLNDELENKETEISQLQEVLDEKEDN